MTSDHDSALREHGYHALVVKAVVPETPDASSFVLDIPDGLRATFRYRPGQFCTFRVRVDGEDHLRSYSMSSSPEADADLTVTVKRVAGGLVSNWLLDHLAAGDVVEATKPAGVFCPQQVERPVVGFCGGSGITPFISITKHVLARTARPIRLLYANRDRDVGDLRPGAGGAACRSRGETRGSSPHRYRGRLPGARRRRRLRGG